MPHPIMFRDDDPGLAELRRIALGFPEAFEEISHGRPVYLAPSGWLGLDFGAAPVDWDEVGELLGASFRLTAPARLIRRLDGT